MLIPIKMAAVSKSFIICWSVRPETQNSIIKNLKKEEEEEKKWTPTKILDMLLRMKNIF